LNVVAGDGSRDGRVDAIDWMQLRAKQRRSITNPGAGVTGYTIYHDLDGNGLIDSFDLLHARRNLLRALPAGEPASAVLGVVGTPTRAVSQTAPEGRGAYQVQRSTGS
jgi:hypothetical protein